MKYHLKLRIFVISHYGSYFILQVTTLEGRPTAPPTNLILEALSSTTIKVTWTPPDGQFINGINQGYKVFARRLNVTQPEIVAVVQQDQSNPTGVQSTVLEK